MVERSKIVRDDQRRVVVARYTHRRAHLKQLLTSPTTAADPRQAVLGELRRQPRDATATRLGNRDDIDGRRRSYLRALGVSRIRLRELAHAG